MKKLLIGAAIAAVTMMGAMTAHAASLSIIGGSAGTLNSGFSLNGSTGLIGGGVSASDVIVFNSGNDGPATGLSLAGAPTAVTFEYLGSEAANTNRAIETEFANNFLFKNHGGGATALYATEVVNFVGSGIMEFFFKTSDGDRKAKNHGSIASGLSIALFQESATSVIALFGDGAGDSDFDDLAMRISVTAVPLPPSVALFGGALLGLGFLARRRRKSASAA